MEDVVFEVDWSEFVLVMPIHQLLKMNSHSLTNFAVSRNHVSTVMSQVEIFSSFARDLCSAVCHSEIWANHLHSILEIAKLHHQESIQPLAVRKNLPSPAPSEPTFNGNVLTGAPMSRFVLTLSSIFGLLTLGTEIQTSK